MATTPRLTVDTTGVRHRLVWGGTYAMLLGTVLIGLGLTITPMWTWIAGCAVVAAGGIAALTGGVMRDVEVREHHMPLDEIRAIEAESLPAASHGPLELEAGETDTQVEEGARLDRFGGLLLLGLTGWLFAAPYLLSFSFTPEAEKAIYHALGLAIVTGLVSLRILTVGPTRIGSGLVAVAAAIFLLYTLARPGVTQADQIVYLVSGALVVLGAVLGATPQRAAA